MSLVHAKHAGGAVSDAIMLQQIKEMQTKMNAMEHHLTALQVNYNIASMHGQCIGSTKEQLPVVPASQDAITAMKEATSIPAPQGAVTTMQEQSSITALQDAITGMNEPLTAPAPQNAITQCKKQPMSQYHKTQSP